MKYFTPELHARTCSTNDAIADAAHSEWEATLARYEKRQQRIRSTFTPGLRQLTNELRLHDARLLLLGQGKGRCYLSLQTEGIPASIVSLEYFLTATPVIETDVLSADVRIAACLFLYDEVDLGTRNGKPTYTHSILFTNGLHVRLKFSDIAVRIVDALIEMPEASSGRFVSQPA